MNFSWHKAGITDRRITPRVLIPDAGHFDGRPSDKSSTDVLAKILDLADQQKIKSFARLRRAYSK